MELALLLKVEFWRVNFWRLLASPPKYFPTKTLCCTVPVNVHHGDKSLNHDHEMKAVWDSENDFKSRRCAAAIAEDPQAKIIDECSIPNYGDPLQFDLPFCTDPAINSVLKDYSDFFATIPGVTTMVHHHIPTTGNPVCVPPRRMPIQYKEDIECQIQQMLERRIIEESTSPWMAPAVFVRKKSGDIHICIDAKQKQPRAVKKRHGQAK